MKLFRSLTSLFLAFALCLPVCAQDPPGRQQDKPIDARRTGFAPASVRFENLAPQNVATWGSLPGNATVSTGVTALDGTTGAASLSITSPPDGYRRLYTTTRTVAVGDWIVAGVWVKGVSLFNGDGSAGTLENFNVATLTLYEATEGYRLDSETTNTRYIAPNSDDADTQWTWLTTAFKVTSATPDKQAQIRFDLNCTNLKSIAFYAPVLHHIASGTITDAEAESLLQNLFPVPDTVPVGGVALQRGQTLYCYSGGSYTPCTSISTGNRQAINVKTDYNAAGDGVSDDSTEANAALAAALSSGRPLYFPAGTYLGVSLTGITYQLKIFGDGAERTILKASAGNTPVIDIGNASSHTIEISDLTIEGAGNASGSSGHGIYVHDQSDGLYNFFVNNVWIKNCGGDGINVRGQFTNKFKAVFVSNCGGNGFDISGGNTILLDSCYVDDVLNNKVAYRIRAGQVVMLNCNGLDSLGSVSDWAVFGQAIADGDPADTYCDAQLIGCNVESFKRYGVWAKVGSRVDAKATFFTTSASGSTHVAIRTDFTNNQVGTFDSQCRFSVQGTGTWANGLPIHSNSDIPIMAIGRTDQTQYYADAAATARSLPSVGVTPIATVPYVYAPKFATDGLLFPTDNTGDIGASGANRPRDLFLGRNLKVSGTTELNSTATQSASVAGFLGWTITNSSSSGQAGIYGINHSGKNVFLQVFQDGTGIAQMGSDHFPIYIKAAGTNRWYFDNLLFSPLQDDTSDLGAGSTRIKDAFLSGSLNLKERTAPSTPAANTLVLYAKDKAGASALYYKNDAGTETEIGGGGGGSGTVNTGAANTLAYYPSSGTTVDDASGLSHSPGASPNFTVTAQNSAHVPLLLQLVASQSANALEVKNSGGSTVFNLTPSGGFTAAGDSIFSLTGSSTGSPRKLQLSNVGSGTAFRMELESEGTGFQAREAGKLQIQARYGVKIVGTRNSTFAPSFESGATTDPALYLENGVTGAIPLRVNAISSTSTNLAEFQSNASTVFSLTTAGVLGVVAASDPGSPTNSDLWRSSSRNAISIRNSGQTEDLSGSMWRSSASVFFDTTTTETSIISDTGVGTKTLAADRLKAGSHIRIKASGFYGTKATSPGTFTIKLKNGATTMLTIAAFTLPTNVADQNWWIEATGALNATGSSGTINWTITFYYNDGTGDLKTRTYTVNSTTINTTTTNTLNITGQFSVSDAANFWQTDVASIEVL